MRFLWKKNSFASYMHEGLAAQKATFEQENYCCHENMQHK